MWEFEIDNDKLKTHICVLYADKAGDAAFEIFLRMPSGNSISVSLDFSDKNYIELRKLIREEIFKNLPEENYERN